MAGYIIGFDVQDAEHYEHYRNAVPASITRYGGRYLVRGGTVEGL